MGIMQFHTQGAPRKFVQTPDVLVILYEASMGVRQIFTDGREIPNDDPQPWWYGYSVGQWEGDTLVVTTKGLRDGEWLDIFGTPLTDAATYTERFRRVNYGRMEIDVTVDDPKAYTAPWTVRVNQRIMPEQELLEFVCNENNRYFIRDCRGRTAARGGRDLVSRRCRFALCAVALTSGCDNAVEHLAVEEWREAGTAIAPSSEARYAVATLAAGAGREVLPGDLVQLRVVAPTGEQREVFVWTGEHTVAESPFALGADGLRAALIGRRVGERFTIGPDAPAREIPWLPMHGAASTAEFPGLTWTWVEDDVRIRARDWPRVDLSSPAGGPSEAQLEVLDACAANLLQRTATLRQWGYVVQLFARPLATRREGTLHWLAFDAACSAGVRRLQVGPLYDDRSSPPGRELLGWEGSYSRLRPPTRVAEAWELTPLR
jgi:hypothetical protein